MCQPGFLFSDFPTLPSRLAATIASVAAAAAKSAAPSTTPAAKLRLRSGFVHGERSAAKLRFVQLGDGFLRVGVRRHLDEREPTGTARGIVTDDVHCIDRACAAEQFT
jgi:hypothetical protein